MLVHLNKLTQAALITLLDPSQYRRTDEKKGAPESIRRLPFFSISSSPISSSHHPTVLFTLWETQILSQKNIKGSNIIIFYIVFSFILFCTLILYFFDVNIVIEINNEKTENKQIPF